MHGEKKRKFLIPFLFICLGLRIRRVLCIMGIFDRGEKKGKKNDEKVIQSLNSSRKPKINEFAGISFFGEICEQWRRVRRRLMMCTCVCVPYSAAHKSWRNAHASTFAPLHAVHYSLVLRLRQTFSFTKKKLEFPNCLLRVVHMNSREEKRN